MIYVRIESIDRATCSQLKLLIETNDRGRKSRPDTHWNLGPASQKNRMVERDDGLPPRSLALKKKLIGLMVRFSRTE